MERLSDIAKESPHATRKREAKHNFPWKGAVMSQAEMATVFDRTRLAQQVKIQRRARGWSQRQLGYYAGVHAVTISKLESQKLPGVIFDTVVRLANVLDLDLNGFMSPKEAMAEPDRAA
jgi:ribosome-binding protein aMBF1 (putative translation factor)